MLGMLLGLLAAVSFGALAWLALKGDEPEARYEVVPEPVAATEPEVKETEEEKQARFRKEQQDKLAKQIAALESEQAAQIEAQKREEVAATKKLEADHRKLIAEQLEKSNNTLARDHDKRALQRARDRVTIRVYSTSWCPACKSARAYMQARGIRFQEFDTELSPTAAAMRDRLNPRRSVPTIDIDGEVMVGFSAERLEHLIDQAARKRAQL